jgi:hypothetical protein
MQRYLSKTVKGPSPLKVSTNPAATAVTSVEKSAFPAATPTMFESQQLLSCPLLLLLNLPSLSIQLLFLTTRSSYYPTNTNALIVFTNFIANKFKLN